MSEEQHGVILDAIAGPLPSAIEASFTGSVIGKNGARLHYRAGKRVEENTGGIADVEADTMAVDPVTQVRYTASKILLQEAMRKYETDDNADDAVIVPKE